MLNCIKKIVKSVRNVLSRVGNQVAELIEETLQNRIVRMAIAALVLMIPGLGMYVAFSVFLALFWNFTIAIAVAAFVLTFSAVVALSSLWYGDSYPRTFLALSVLSRTATAVVVFLVTMPLVLPMSIAAGSFSVAALLVKVLV